MASHIVSFCKWHSSEILRFRTSASTVAAMALGVPRADFLESRHMTLYVSQMDSPLLNLLPCKGERSSENWVKVQTTVLSF